MLCGFHCVIVPAPYAGHVRGRPWRRGVVTVLAVGLLLAVVFLSEPYTDTRCLGELTLPRGIDDETGEYDENHSFWPPGTECVYKAPDGRVFRAVVVPWFEWIVLATFAVGLGVAFWLVRRLFERARRQSP